MMRRYIPTVIVLVLATRALEAADFQLAPAVAVEAEDFTVEKGWQVIQNGHGNYMVDCVGFNHISGERLLGLDAKRYDPIEEAPAD